MSKNRPCSPCRSFSATRCSSCSIGLHPRPWETFREGILPFLQSGILRYPLTEAVTHRAARFVGLGLTGYDAMYASLAEVLGACWLTFDAGAHTRIAAERVSFDLNAGLPPQWP